MLPRLFALCFATSALLRTGGGGALALVLSLFCSFFALSLTTPVHASSDVWQNQMIANERFIRLGDLRQNGTNTVVHFWHIDCPPCRKELIHWHRLAQQGSLTLISISLHRLSDEYRLTDEEKAALGAPVKRVFTAHGKAPQRLLRQFANSKGALPYTVVFSARQQVCKRLLGPLNEHEIKGLEKIIEKDCA